MKLFSAFSAIILLGLVACSKPQAPVYGGLEDIRINSVTMGESALSANLKYYNPNSFAMKLKSGEMGVYVNDRFLGKTTLDTSIQVPARDSFLIPVSMKVKMKEVFSNALDILMNNEVNLRLDGYARLAKGAIGFTIPIKYEGKQSLDIHL